MAGVSPEMICSPRAMSFCRSVSVNRLIRGRYFSTSFMPEVVGAVLGVTGFFIFTREIWHRGRSRSTGTFHELWQGVLHGWRAPSWAEIAAAEKADSEAP